MYIGIAAMGLNLLTGYNGQVSIGHGAFFGIGAYTTALLMDHQYDVAGHLLRPHVVHRDAAGRRGRLVRHRRARRVPGAAREGPLPRAGHARAGGDLPRPREPLRERHRRHEPGVADGREVAAPDWFAEHFPACRRRTSGPTRCASSVALVGARSSCGCSSGAGSAGRSSRCAITRRRPRRSASTSRARRCSRSR